MVNDNIDQILFKEEQDGNLDSFKSSFVFFENADLQKIKFLYTMIKEREDINEKLTKKIDENIIYACNRLHEIEGNFSERSEMATWQKQLMDMELKKEIETLNLFKDTSTMKMELMKEWINYIEITKMNDI